MVYLSTVDDLVPHLPLSEVGRCDPLGAYPTEGTCAIDRTCGVYSSHPATQDTCIQRSRRGVKPSKPCKPCKSIPTLFPSCGCSRNKSVVTGHAPYNSGVEDCARNKQNRCHYRAVGYTVVFPINRNLYARSEYKQTFQHAHLSAPSFLTHDLEF